MTKCVALAAASITLLMAPVVARADKEAPKEPASSPVVTLTAAPMFGQDATTGMGWSDIVARIENVSKGPQKGTIELSSAGSYDGSDKFNAKAPFNVPAGKSAVVRLPVHGSSYYAPATVAAIGDSGQRLASATVTMNATPAPLLVDIDQPSRVSVVLRAWPMATSWGATGASPYYGGGPAATTSLSIGVPSFDRTTGDPVLPEHAAGYAPVTAVLVHSDLLARLGPVEQDALLGWAIAGGTLAIVPSRPEDLRGPVLSSLAGGEVSPGNVPEHLFKLPGAYRPQGTSSFDPPTPPTPDDDAPAPQKQPSGIGSMGPGPMPIAPRIGPAPDVKDKLRGWVGGNLQPSDFGASAAYGLGEVHLLAFDPTSAPMLDDPWVRARMIDMVVRAWERHALLAFPHGMGERNSYRIDEVRRALDPNENFRIGLGVSALLLVLYSIVAGPLTFLRAAKKGTPLRPLLWVPMWSAAAFGAIVLVGLAGKGWHGRARRISLVEMGAGVTRGTVRRYRGFFASETRSLVVKATDRTCVLDVATGDSSSHENAALRLDRYGAALENLTGLPWQTVVVREDGFFELKDGVTVASNTDGSVDVVNRSGATMKDVLVWVPGDKVTYFDEVKDGARIRSTAGRTALASTSRRTQTSGSRTVHPLGARDIGYAVSGKYDGPVARAWASIESAAGEAVDWWPDDVPVVMGELVGVEKATRDAGLAVESDRVLVRVVGKGGMP